MIGIRGSFTRRIERTPIRVKSKVDAKITKKVHKNVFKRIFADRNLLMAQIAVVKIKGTTIYLPILINNSDKNERTLRQVAFSVGRTKAARIPSATPIKYFTQTFIN